MSAHTGSRMTGEGVGVLVEVSTNRCSFPKFLVGVTSGIIYGRVP